MIHSLLNNHWIYCCRIEACEAEERKLFRGLRNKGYCPAELRALFKDVIKILEKKWELEGVKGD